MISRSDRELTGPFWSAVEREELVRPVCANCQTSFFTPLPVCPNCQSSDWSYVASSGLGKIYSYTTIHRPPDPMFQAPYVLADVEMDEGWRMMTWIVDCSLDDVRIDLPVQVEFIFGPDGLKLPAFTPVETS